MNLKNHLSLPVARSMQSGPRNKIIANTSGKTIEGRSPADLNPKS